MNMTNTKRVQVLTRVGVKVRALPSKSRVFMLVAPFMKKAPLHSCILDFPIYTAPYVPIIVPYSKEEGVGDLKTGTEGVILINM
jgi:hypothetical protein